ncbi:mitochondrial Homoaconitase [Kappamyces sp. JEL0680]|nr:mitochondrial Homoaconitase [Kappamyces sp. JEL0680]
MLLRAAQRNHKSFYFRRLVHSQTLVEKIVERFTLDAAPRSVKQGDFVSIAPHRVMTHDNTGAVIQKFNSIGAPKFHDSTQIVFTLDHDVQNTSETNLKKYRNIREFAKKHHVDFYPAGSGIGHQLMAEQGYAFPFTMTVASDSHSNMYGGIGCLGTPIVRTDAAAIWATGRTWWQVPPVVKVELTNKPAPGVTGKDIIVTLCGVFNKDQVLNTAIEFVGDGIKHLSVDDRLTIANMTTEWGALAGIFPVDEKTLAWYEAQKEKLAALYGNTHSRINEQSLKMLRENRLDADPDAFYAKHLTLDLSTVSPYVAGPNSVKKASPLVELEKQKIAIQKAYLVSCTNSRASDIRQAAQALQGQKIAPGVEFYIAAASMQVQKDVEVSGHWQTLLDAGAKPLPAGCGPCIDGEVGISATNRNYKGRMGSPNAQAYLASPAVVASSAVKGYIAGPFGNVAFPDAPVFTSSAAKAAKKKDKSLASGIAGFDSRLKGEILFCDADNLNTDGIYPGKYTYQDDMTPEMMAQNDILVCGFNFGSGSSREQAATALLHRGIKLVLAASFSETFKRNAINNGLMVLESPELVQYLREAFRDQPKELTRRTGLDADIDLIQGSLAIPSRQIEMDIPSVGVAAQELIVSGGLENWVKARI